MIKFLLFISFLTVFFNSCSVSEKIEKNFIKMKKYNFFKNEKNKSLLNFDSAAENIILDMLKSNNIFVLKNTLFFIDTLENKTDVAVNNEKFTNLIKDKIYKNFVHVNFLEKNIIEKNKKKLGILNTKNPIDTSTAILVSRNNNVKYYLRSFIYEKNEKFLLKIKLILVKTGEIVFMKEENFYF